MQYTRLTSIPHVSSLQTKNVFTEDIISLQTKKVFSQYTISLHTILVFEILNTPDQSLLKWHCNIPVYFSRKSYLVFTQYFISLQTIEVFTQYSSSLDMKRLFISDAAHRVSHTLRRLLIEGIACYYLCI